MNLSSFFASIGENFRHHYESLTRMLDREETPFRSDTRTPLSDNEKSVPVRPAEDSVEISPESRQRAQASDDDKDVESSPTTRSDASAVENDDDDDGVSKPVTTESPDKGVQPDGTYRFQRRSRLDYEMNLQFDLGTFTRTIENLSEGDVESVEELVAGGFGLSADLNFVGKSITHVRDTSGERPQSANVTNSRGLGQGQQSSLYRTVSDNFAVDAFTREAHHIRRRTHSLINPAGHQLAINRFSMRYSLDTNFSFAHLDRFNVQTRQVADDMPEAVNSYVEKAGQVAEQGSNEMMTAFFDTVDSYTGQAEERLIENAQAFLDAAAKELGFSEETMDMAEEHLIGSIESFFDKVDSAVTQLQAQYAPATDATAMDTVQPVDTQVEPQELYDPAVAEEQETVAMA